MKSKVKPMDVPSKMKPTLHLNHDDLKELGLKMPAVGEKFRAKLHGKVVSTSVHEHDGGDKRSSVMVEVHKLKPHGKPASKEGMVANPAADGAKAAMDGALQDAGERDLARSEDAKRKGKKK